MLYEVITIEPGKLADIVVWKTDPLADIHSVEDSANAVHVVVAEVDVATGFVSFLKYVIVHDCGRQLNPGIVKLHKGPKPIFTRYELEDQIASIFENRVELKSGGYIV